LPGEFLAGCWFAFDVGIPVGGFHYAFLRIERFAPSIHAPALPHATRPVDALMFATITAALARGGYDE
jgi:hypothetical protein